MISIINGQFLLDGQSRPYHFQTAFKWPSYFYDPHKDLGKARALLQRYKALNFDGIRVFDEHFAWKGHPFFEHGAPLNEPWNLRMGPNSSFHLSEQQKKAYMEMVSMLQREGMFAELVINVTVKQEPGYLDGRHERMVRYWERMQRVVLQYLRTIGAENLILENCNEFDAHVPREAYEFLRKDSNGVDLVPRMASRARIDFPGRPYGISRGGTWEVDPGVPGEYTHINIHSPRHGTWWDIHGQLATLKAHYPAKPIALNENMHGMSRKQWQYWVAEGHHPNPSKLANQSRPDTDDNVEFMRRQWRKAEQFGVSYCLHNANGIFSDPDLPEDGFELAWAKDHGGSPPPPPPSTATTGQDSADADVRGQDEERGLEAVPRSQGPGQGPPGNDRSS